METDGKEVDGKDDWDDDRNEWMMTGWWDN